MNIVSDMQNKQSTQRLEKLYIHGMTCPACAARIEAALLALPGVGHAQATYADGTAVVRYETGKTGHPALVGAVEGAGYTVYQPGASRRQRASMRRAGLLLLIAALYLLWRALSRMGLFNAFPTAQAGMGYGALFVVGLFTSVHCVAMCGGIGLSQSLPAGKGSAPHRQNLVYNLGRLASYTATGALVGALGSVFSLGNSAQGLIQLAAGLFMVAMGVNMLGLFPALRRYMPRLPGGLGDRLHGQAGKGPLVVGLLNGLMPCGPLQAMQLYALSTGSALQGGLAMLSFGLGTLPLLVGLGAAGALLGRRFRAGVTAAGAVLVVVLGLSTLTNGLALAGVAAPGASHREQVVAARQEDVQAVDTVLQPGSYPAIQVVAGVPVRWTVTAGRGSINGCNYRLYLPEYNLEVTLTEGENVIEFTPETAGTFGYSCWMGMIRSTITVTEGL